MIKKNPFEQADKREVIEYNDWNEQYEAYSALQTDKTTTSHNFVTLLKVKVENRSKHGVNNLPTECMHALKLGYCYCGV